MVNRGAVKNTATTHSSELSKTAGNVKSLSIFCTSDHIQFQTSVNITLCRYEQIYEGKSVFLTAHLSLGSLVFCIVCIENKALVVCSRCPHI